MTAKNQTAKSVEFPELNIEKKAVIAEKHGDPQYESLKEKQMKKDRDSLFGPTYNEIGKPKTE